MSQVTVSTTFNIDVEFELSPFHKRLLAWVVDLFIMLFYLIIAGKILAQFNLDSMEWSDLYGIYTLVYLPVLC